MQTKRDNYSMGCFGLSAGTAGSVSTANACDYAISGRTYRKAAAANVALVLKTETPALAATSLAANQATCLFFFIDAAGTITYKQAAVKVGPTGPAYQAGGFEWPQDEPNHACIGAVKISTAAAQTFVPGTTVPGTANTATFYNVGDDLGVPIPL